MNRSGWRLQPVQVSSLQCFDDIVAQRYGLTRDEFDSSFWTFKLVVAESDDERAKDARLLAVHGA